MLGILLGIVVFGKKFAGASILASVAFAAFYGLYGHFPPLLPDLSHLPITAAVLGGLFVGLGEGLLLKVGAASGWDASIALIMREKFHIKISLWYTVTDVSILLFSLVYLPVGSLIYSLITVLVSNSVIALAQLEIAWQEQRDVRYRRGVDAPFLRQQALPEKFYLPRVNTSQWQLDYMHDT